MTRDPSGPAYSGSNTDSFLRFEWVALLVVFLLAGTIGHDPWKQDETYSFGVIWHFYNTHTWLVPVNAGMPFMEKPPLYYWTAVLSAKLFSGLMPLYDAARMASVFYMLVTTIFTWKLSQALFSNDSNRISLGWGTIALLLGSVGLVRHAHDMFTDVALLSGTVITLYGMALLATRQECWRRAGVWLGCGIAIAFMSKGLLTPAILCISGFALWCILPELRTRKTFFAIVLAVLFASPSLIWPALLYHQSHDLFLQWFWQNNIGRFFGFSVSHLGADNKSCYFLYTILWFALPALPLALITTFYKRANWRNPAYILPLVVIITGMVVLSISASARALYLIPLLPACALLAVQALPLINARFLSIGNIVMRVIFSLCGICIVFVWWGLLHPGDQALQPILHLAGRWLPVGFTPKGSQAMNYILAALICTLWLLTLRLRADSQANMARIWFSGMALLWVLSHSLLLPWIDETKSYRPVIESMDATISSSPYAGACMSNTYLGESISPMLEYFGSRHAVGAVETFNTSTCPLFLTVMAKEIPADVEPGWTLLWKGARALDEKDEELRLYAHMVDKKL